MNRKLGRAVFKREILCNDVEVFIVTFEFNQYNVSLLIESINFFKKKKLLLSPNMVPQIIPWNFHDMCSKPFHTGHEAVKSV